jgi:hypothetical protein
MAEKSVVQRIKELDAERATILEQAKEELLRKATQSPSQNFIKDCRAFLA